MSLKASNSFPHVNAANKYARDVVKGRVSACKWVRLQCQKHLDDLQASKKRNFAFKFDRALAEKWCKWVELFPHTKGIWARERKKLKLEPWQCFKTAAIFGWVNKSDGLRRYTEAFLLIPRKNAKSTWAAAIGLGALCIDNEFGAEVYTGATTETQAWEVFRPAKKMASMSPKFLKRFNIEVNAGNLHRLSDGSKMEPLIGNPGDGQSPSMAIVDEYHEHKSDSLVETMRSGMLARPQPLTLYITTAGKNIAGPCFEKQQQVQKILEGTVKDDHLFALIYTIDEKDDWSDPVVLKKANPNFGVSIFEKNLLKLQQDAINFPDKLGVFKTKNLNVWTTAGIAQFDIEKWALCERPKYKLEDFFGQPCRFGLDLAEKTDITAHEIVFDLDECDCHAATELKQDGFTLMRFGRYYLPSEAIHKPQNDHYQRWLNAGYMFETDGSMTDYTQIESDILALTEKFQVHELAYDPYHALMMAQRLSNKGVPVVEVRATVASLSEPFKQTDAEIRALRIAHDGDPVYRWMLSNVLNNQDKKSNWFPTKNRDGKSMIDGPMAHIMVKARMMVVEEDEPDSVYETRGALVF